MFYSNKSVALLTSSLITLGFATQAMAGSIGLVDKDKVVTSYPKAQQAAEQLKKDEENVHKMIESSNKQYEDAKNAKKPPAELQTLQKTLQASIDKEVKRIQGSAQNLEKDLEKQIDDAIKAEATAQKCDTVLLKQAVLIGGTDITDGVVKRLASSGAAATK